MLISRELQTEVADVLIPDVVSGAPGSTGGSEPAAGAIGSVDGVTVIGAGSELSAPFLCCDEGSAEVSRKGVRDAHSGPRWGSLRGTMPDGLSFSPENRIETECEPV